MTAQPAVPVAANLAAVHRRIAAACKRSGRSPGDITLVAITKNVAAPDIKAAFAAGQRHFGENRVQEALNKCCILEDIRKQTTWHMVGHLQTNKAVKAVQLFDVIQSVDSLALAEALNRRATALGCILPVYIQVNVAGEPQKSGQNAADAMYLADSIGKLPNLKLTGLMTIAPAVPDPEQVRPVFRKLSVLKGILGLEHLSMGMTDDFEVAIEEGATVLRIGRAIFSACF